MDDNTNISINKLFDEYYEIGMALSKDGEEKEIDNENSAKD
ncbi:MAG: hypothetical protein WCW16_02225 [Candidatus Magasanikbacteria bacterium]